MSKHLLLIDFQNGFIRSGMNTIKANIQAAVSGSLFDDITVTQFNNFPASPWSRILQWQGLQTEDEQAVAVSLPNTARIFKKYSYGLNEEILSWIKSCAEKQMIFVAGLETDICVTVCAAQLFDASLAPFIIQDCIGSTKGKEVHDRALYSLSRIVGQDRLVTLDAVKTISESS